MRLITRKSECKKYTAGSNTGTQHNTVTAIRQFTTLNYAITCRPLSEHNHLVIFKTQIQEGHHRN